MDSTAIALVAVIFAFLAVLATVRLRPRQEPTSDRGDRDSFTDSLLTNIHSASVTQGGQQDHV